MDVHLHMDRLVQQLTMALFQPHVMHTVTMQMESNHHRTPFADPEELTLPWTVVLVTDCARVTMVMNCVVIQCCTDA